jgi:hydrogenase expression/formation protein HypC
MCLAIPARIEAIDDRDPAYPTATVETGGAPKTVQLIYVPEATVGSYVIVQAGFAVRLVPEPEALEAIAAARALATGADGTLGGRT